MVRNLNNTLGRATFAIAVAAVSVLLALIFMVLAQALMRWAKDRA